MPRQATDSKETIKLAVSALMEVATVDETGKNIEVAVLRRGCVPALLLTYYARRNRAPRPDSLSADEGKAPTSPRTDASIPEPWTA